MILFDVGVDDDDVTRLVGVDAGLLDDVNAEVDLAEVDEGICVVDDEFFFKFVREIPVKFKSPKYC